MNSPLVSILIPVYNVEAYLPKCLDTVLGQTYTNLQVILIDDGSKDNSWKVMEEYAAKDKRVEIYHQENQGVSPTRNHLLEKVKGDYVLFVDSDDWIELDMVKYMLELAQKYKSGFVMCDRVVNDTAVSRVEPKVFKLNQEQAIADFLRHEYFIGSLCNKMFDSRLLENLKVSTDIFYGEDALFCWGVLQKVDSVISSSRQLYHYRQVLTSISHSDFCENKFSEHKVWEIITNDVENKWPQFVNIALSTWSIADLYLLQDAAQSEFPNNDKIKLLQQNIRRNCRLWIPRLRGDVKILIYSLIIMRFYAFGMFYYYLFRFKKALNNSFLNK